ncbi:MAG TPA: hypothetical protein VFP05_10020 [Thermomicrobiales bacterium]|nr:hypothetical protein [Thermomicrobiales bacterium]
MKRLVMIATLLMLLGLTSQGIAAQDASPAAEGSPSTALLDGLGYPALSVVYDGSAITMADTLEAGRYLLDFSNTSGSEPQIATFLGATDDHPVDEILTALQSVDPAQGPPPIYYQIKVSGLTESGQQSVITLTPGDWLFLVVGDSGPAIAQFTVTGEMPEYDAIADAVNVDLHEMAIDMPDTIPAGDHIWQVENTGSFVHFIQVMKVTGPITDAEVVNALALEMGGPGATPVESGSVGDPSTFTPAAGSGDFSNGLTQLVEANLEPGTYVAFCFLSGPGDVGMHAMQGMYKIFTVE